MDLFPKSSNFECIEAIDISFGTPMRFGYDFIPKGDLRFSFFSAESQSKMIVLCSPFLFVVKELVRRSQYNATPLLYDDPRVIYSTKYNETLSGALSKLYYNDLDLFLHYVKLTAYKYDFCDGFVNDMRPLYQILGGVYKSNFEFSSEQFGFINSFDSSFWMYFIITLAFMPLLITILKQFSESIKGRQYLRQNGSHWKERNKFNEKCLTFKDLSNKIVNQYSTVFTAMFASQNLKTKNDMRLVDMMTIAGILLSSLVILNIFSALLFSSRIIINKNVIDSIEDLDLRKDLIPLLPDNQYICPFLNKYGTPAEKILCSSKARHDNGTVTNTFSKSEEYIRLVGNQRTHALITHGSIIDAIININRMRPFKNQVELHKSKNSYYVLAEAMVYRKNLPQDIINLYQQIMWSMAETGLHSKWYTTGRSQIAQIVIKFKEFSNSEDQSLETRKNFEQWLGLWQTLILASGPLLYGMLISILILLIELNSYYLKNFNTYFWLLINRRLRNEITVELNK